MLYIRAMSGQNEDETIEQIISHDASQEEGALDMDWDQLFSREKQTGNWNSVRIKKRCCLMIKYFLHLYVVI